MDYESLFNEIDLDPLGRGYSGMTDTQIAADLNTEYRTRNLERLSATEVFNAIDKSEWDLLLETHRATIFNLLHMGQLNPFGVEASIFVDIFGGGSTTISDLSDMRTEAVSRAAELGFPRIYIHHIETARDRFGA